MKVVPLHMRAHTRVRPKEYRKLSDKLDTRERESFYPERMNDVKTSEDGFMEGDDA